HPRDRGDGAAPGCERGRVGHRRLQHPDVRGSPPRVRAGLYHPRRSDRHRLGRFAGVARRPRSPAGSDGRPPGHDRRGGQPRHRPDAPDARARHRQARRRRSALSLRPRPPPRDRDQRRRRLAARPRPCHRRGPGATGPRGRRYPRRAPPTAQWPGDELRRRARGRDPTGPPARDARPL
ncbi:MAG: hypothetical protein AVDCRST_MAG88-1189, partial [uncultured Thermomicrobiales bacterium]